MRRKARPPHVVAEDDAWVEGRSLIETVEDVELIDPALSSERLVYRLFHERGVRVFKSVADRGAMLCSRDGVEAMLRSFSQDDRDHMVENGVISVTCEFCSANYQFAPDEVRRRCRHGEARRGKADSHDRERAPDCRGDCRGGRGDRAFDAVRARAKLSGAARRRPAAGAGHRRHHERHGRDACGCTSARRASEPGARSARPSRR